MTKRGIPSPRPKNLNLLSIRLPLPAWVSILHRISGLLLFLFLPALLLLLDVSLRSQQGYQSITATLQHPLSKGLLLLLIAALAHHFLAGIRHLALDARWISGLAKARLSGKLVLVLDGLLILGAACWLI